MALPSSGSAISFSQINTEIGRSATAALSMDDATLRLVFGVSSGQISMSQGQGKSYALNVSYFVLAGGAAGAKGVGGYSYGGAGGGGGYYTGADVSFQMGVAYTVTVGAGGTGVQGSQASNPGSSSQFSTYTPGGGNGGSNYGDGGSSGSPQNNSGAGRFSFAQYSGGAGGGAGGSTGGSTGGAGVSSSYSGSSNTYGGGGGGSSDYVSGSGQDGGGNGGYQGSAPTSGAANRGGGGGSTRIENGNPGGSGGSGVVLLRIPVARTATFSAGVSQTSTSDATYKYYTITAAGASDTVTFS